MKSPWWRLFLPGEAGGGVGVVAQLKGNTGDMITYLCIQHDWMGYLDKNNHIRIVQ